MLERLDLSHCNVGAEGAAVLGAMLKGNKGLRVLLLANTRLGTAGGGGAGLAGPGTGTGTATAPGPLVPSLACCCCFWPHTHAWGRQLGGYWYWPGTHWMARTGCAGGHVPL